MSNQYDVTDKSFLDEPYVPSNKKKNPLQDPQFVKSKQIDSDDDSSNDNANFREDEAPPISMLQLYRYSTGKDKFLYFIGILCSFATGLTTPANSFIIGRLADAMITQGSAMINTGLESDTEISMDEANQAFLESIAQFAITNSVLGVITFCGSYLSVTLFNYAAHNQIFRIRSTFLRSALNQDISWYDFNKSGEFASRINEDLSKLEEGLGEKVCIFINFIVAFFGSITLAFVKGWELSLICLISLPVTLISVGTVGMITSKLAKQEMTAYAKAGSIAEEVFSAIRTVVAFGGEKKEVERYKANLVDAKNINIKRGFFSGLGFGLLWFFIYASYALAFWYGVGLVIKEKGWSDEDRTYSPGVMFTVFLSVMMGSMNLGIASPYIEVFGIAKGAAGKVFATIERKPTIDPLADRGEKPDQIHGNIKFKNVEFNYPSRPDVPILRGLNINIEHGQTVAIVGPSGCGKSTCIQLVQRFYDVLEGDIFIDDNSIKNLNINWLRSNIGVVGQEPVLFNTTIYENIRYGRENANREEIEAAAEAANAHYFIKRLPNGYETLVGERGAQISGGQKQRIAIARALVRNPAILLLDEATSALDTASEAKVQVALEKASKGRTTIIIAHRLSTIRNADRIIVLKDGLVVEDGTHSELVSLNGHYYELITSQVGDPKDDKFLMRSDSLAKKENKDDEDDLVENIKTVEVDLEETTGKSVPLTKIMLLSKPEYRHIIVGSIAAIICGFGTPIFAILFGEIIGVLASDDVDYIRHKTNIYSLYFVIAGGIIGLCTFLQIYTYGIAGEILTERLRGMAFSSILRQEMGWFDQKTNGTGTLCARLSGDAAAVQGATGQRIGTVLQSLSTLGLGIGLSMYYEWRLGLIAVAIAPFILIATFFQRRVMEKENFGSAKAMEQSTKLAVEVVSSIRTVVSLGKEKMFHEQYMSLLAPSLKVAKKNTHYRGGVYGLARSIVFFAFAICMWYGGYLVANSGLYYARVFKVAQALIMGTVSIANALAFAPNFQKGLTAAGKIFQIFERTPKVLEPSPINDRLDDWKAHGNVDLKNVTFRYPSRPDSKVLNSLSMKIFEGKTIALVGSSGCGKSTCIQLIERFYDVESGSVEIDSIDVRSASFKQLRSQLGLVSQEPSLFDRTISENIAYGDNNRVVTQNEVIEAAKKANIHNFISSLPLGYETRAGEKATQLSGGQKQRIAIARALIRNPQILLLDEATSALDSESEKIVQEALDAAREGRTCITIAHRLSTIVDADVILVIHAGEVVEQGTHQELLKFRGIYYGLYKLQSGNR